MKFCKRCDKDTPTVVVEKIEECMVCGSPIESVPKKQDIYTKTAIESLKNITKKDDNNGNYSNAQTVGRNVSIGLFIILLGILYTIGGLSMVFWGIATLVTFLFIAAVFIYIAAMRS